MKTDKCIRKGILDRPTEGWPQEGKQRAARIVPKRVTLYAVEEQQIYREVYWLIFPAAASVSLLGISTAGGASEMSHAVSELKPDVLLCGVRKVDCNIIRGLEQIREDNRGIGIVLLFAYYEAEDIERLTEMALTSEGGMAILLKQSLDRTEQLRAIILAVSQGEIILDPALITTWSTNKPVYRFLKRLSSRELQVLGLVSTGYTNSSIAQALDINAETVEHYVNSMHGTLQAESSL